MRPFLKIVFVTITCLFLLLQGVAQKNNEKKKGALQNREIFNTEHIFSNEELTTEIGASFLNALCGIDNTVIEESVAYIAGWLNTLKNDKHFIFRASGRAQYAVVFILQESKVEAV